MNLDSRIKSSSDILTGLDIEKAKQFIGQKGYFAGDPYCFTDLQSCPYDTLENVFDNDCDTFQRGEFRGEFFYPYFIPESSLKPKEKFIPFRYLSELTDAGIEVGKVISIRNKNDDVVVTKVLVTEINYNYEDNEVINITLGATGYEFPTLCNSYLLMVNGEWKPFGVEEE